MLKIPTHFLTAESTEARLKRDTEAATKGTARASPSREANSPSETEGVAARPGEYDLAVENMENV